MRRFFTILTIACVLGLTPATTFACPLCAEATEEQSGEDDSPNIAMGYAVSILGMMSLPFIIVGGFGFALYKTHKASLASPPPSGE